MARLSQSRTTRILHAVPSRSVTRYPQVLPDPQLGMQSARRRCSKVVPPPHVLTGMQTVLGAWCRPQSGTIVRIARRQWARPTWCRRGRQFPRCRWSGRRDCRAVEGPSKREKKTPRWQVGKQFDRPLYAVVSEDFVSGAGSMVRTLSAPRATPGAISTSRVAQEPIAFRSERPEVATAATATAARAAAAVSRCGGRFHLLELPVERPVNMVIGNRSAVVILDNRRRESRAATSEGVEAARKASRGDRWGGEGDAIVSPGGDNGGGSSDGADGGAAAASAEEAAAAEEEAEAAEAKEKLRLLQLQSLKYSTLWLMVQMEKVRVGAPADGRDGGGGTRLRPALEKLEQWLVGFPCRVLIRYSYSEAQLAELITHAATTEQQQQQPRRKTKGVGATSVAITGAGDSSAQGPGGKRQRLDAGVSPGTEAPSEGSVSRNAAAGAGVRSPLEAVDERSRADSDWAGMHHRQAWFLQLFPALNAFSASALLSCASLKHLIVAPFDELAPGLLGRSGGGDYVPGTDGRSSSGVGAARGGVKAECLLDFCSAVRLEGEQGNG
ncbi:expressed unknown protein [Ectocarpus siliculosus]|uniref:Uncharacterized protein n=1 Tax=Ectocarpus siliculosus TaxID=2880 RepID=D7FJV7_ECTSI|nr:expressed unknown protein [Ectocarpus siliculosus]|eukprot:CBJ29205.1 expressed unknown protein [Ectocarpus siliculosus]